MGFLGLGGKPRDVRDFEALVESHLDSLYRAALRYTRDEAAAQDLVQDTVVRALRFRDKFEMGTNFRGWIHTILHHTFVHRYRRQKKERELLHGTSKWDVERELRSESTHESAENPEESYLDRMMSDDVLRALDALPDDYRTVVTLCDLEGLSYKDIAEVIDKPIGTVMSRLYRGRRALEKKLAGLAVERGIIRPPQENGNESEGAEVVPMPRLRKRRR